MCNNPDYDHITLKTSETGQHIGFTIESNDSGALGSWAIERHLDAIPSKKENLERSYRRQLLDAYTSTALTRSK